MSVDLSKIRPGDEVLVRLIVRKDDRNGSSDFRGLSYIMCENPYGERGAQALAVLASEIISHTPKSRPLEVGDRVRTTSESRPGTIRHIIDSYAWVDWDSGAKCVDRLFDLERLDD